MIFTMPHPFIGSCQSPSGPLMFIPYHQANIGCFRRSIWKRILMGYRERKYYGMINTAIFSYRKASWRDSTRLSFCLNHTYPQRECNASEVLSWICCFCLTLVIDQAERHTCKKKNQWWINPYVKLYTFKFTVPSQKALRASHRTERDNVDGPE